MKLRRFLLLGIASVLLLAVFTVDVIRRTVDLDIGSMGVLRNAAILAALFLVFRFLESVLSDREHAPVKRIGLMLLATGGALVVSLTLTLSVPTSFDVKRDQLIPLDFGLYYLPSIPKNTYLGGLTYNLTGGGKLMPISAVPMLVEIDIKPRAYPNTINLGSKGKVPVAILTTDVFDAGTVDPTTVTFADAAPIKWEMVDVDNDGDIDLLLYFNIQEFKLDENSTNATLTVTISDVIKIIGTDSVKIVTKGKKYP